MLSLSKVCLVGCMASICCLMLPKHSKHIPRTGKTDMSHFQGHCWKWLPPFPKVGYLSSCGEYPSHHRLHTTHLLTSSNDWRKPMSEIILTAAGQKSSTCISEEVLSHLYEWFIMIQNGNKCIPPKTNDWNLKITPLKRKIIWTQPPFLGSMLVFGDVADIGW